MSLPAKRCIRIAITLKDDGRRMLACIPTAVDFVTAPVKPAPLHQAKSVDGTLNSAWLDPVERAEVQELPAAALVDRVG